MKRKWQVFLVGAAAALALAQPASAQQEQWLNYRTSADADSVVGKTPGQVLEFAAEKPEKTALPAFTAKDPLFARWKTPAVPAGFLWIALDRSSANGPYDLLYIDSNADGSLADQTPIKASSAAAFEAQQSAEFRQVKLLLPGEDGPAAYHLNLNVWLGSQTKRIVAQAAGWYEGNVQIGDKKHGCVLFDSNANGAFNDACADYEQSDCIKIDSGSPFVIGRVGKYIQADGAMYELQVARDGAFVRFNPAKDISLATVKVNGSAQKFSAGGQNGLFVVSVSDGQAKLPAGKYRLSHWEIQKKDDTGAQWDLAAAAPVDFEVAADKQATLNIGEPVSGWVAYARQDRTWVFSEPRLKGRLGERITITRGGQMPPPPALLIANADGTYKSRFTFEYG
jgi:hypothetical protein